MIDRIDTHLTHHSQLYGNNTKQFVKEAFRKETICLQQDPISTFLPVSHQSPSHSQYDSLPTAPSAKKIRPHERR